MGLKAATMRPGSEPITRRCPEGHAALLDERGLHYCWTCREYVHVLEFEDEMMRDHYRSPAYDMPEEEQRWWHRILKKWGPRIAAWVDRRV